VGKIKGSTILALLPWIAVIHLYHTSAAHQKRAAELEHKIDETSDLNEQRNVMYSGSAIMYAAKIERNLDDFQAVTSQEHQDIWRAMSLLQKQIKKGK
jgi:predicted RNA-binding protein with PIN domain